MTHRYYWLDDNDPEEFGKIHADDEAGIRVVIREMFASGDLESEFADYLFEKCNDEIVHGFIENRGHQDAFYDACEENFIDLQTHLWLEDTDDADSITVGGRTFTAYVEKEE